MSDDDLKAAAKSIRAVLETLPVEYATSDAHPADHLIRALGLIEMAAYFNNLKAQGFELHGEIHNETYQGQAAINIMNGLPPDADPSEVKGCFNDFLQDLLPPKSPN